MKILSVIGTRPQFVKAAVICRATRNRAEIVHKVVDTGQHYDAAMSDVFFQELGIPAPEYNLAVGSASHGIQTGEMLKRLDPVLVSEKPDWVLVYGDTNSTLAGVLAASKLHIATAHIEAGMRSYNRSAPEEINRLLTDKIADLLLCATPYALDNLRKERLEDRALVTGDVMYDAYLTVREAAEARSASFASACPANEFALATIHRADNTDNPDRLKTLLGALERVAREICPVLLPVHPRTRGMLANLGYEPSHIKIVEPVSYLNMLYLLKRACFVMTDSGGVQKEAYFAQTPCITMRDETEWNETLENGCNVLTGADEAKIFSAALSARRAGPWRAVFGAGDAAEQILQALQGARELTLGPSMVSSSVA